MRRFSDFCVAMMAGALLLAGCAGVAPMCQTSTGVVVEAQRCQPLLRLSPAYSAHHLPEHLCDGLQRSGRNGLSWHDGGEDPWLPSGGRWGREHLCRQLSSRL